MRFNSTSNDRRMRALDFLWLAALMLFVVVGMPLATFHGDEAMQIYASHDYAAAFLRGDPASLMTEPPYPIDSDQHLRILNGSINRYAIGLWLHLAGFGEHDLPPAPGWDWGFKYAENLATNHRPSEALLNASRISSTLFLALSVIVMFGLGKHFGGRLPAYIASGLYALHPAILVNGRRAMQEGSLLFFGLLTVWIAASIAHRRAEGKSAAVGWWLGWALAAGLTLASKHSGIVFVAGAAAWLLAAELTRLEVRAFLRTSVKLVLACALALGLFIGLSPALWHEPVARVGDLLVVRADLLDIQVAISPDAPMTFGQRVAMLLLEPFLRAPMHYEVASWGEDQAVLAEIARYMESPLSGWQFGPIIGLGLTLIAAVGLVSAAAEAVRRSAVRVAPVGLLALGVVVAASLLANPLPWQRYALAWLTVAILLCALGFSTLIGWFWTTMETNAPASGGARS
jgi:4-amino-4-deoxy-L-arabinose transferase-like glycosyltransferase